jgi:hypothetical protein
MKLHRHIASINSTSIDDGLFWNLLFPRRWTLVDTGEEHQCDEASYKSIMAHITRWGVDLHVDYNHASEAATPLPEAAVAAGWVKDYRWADDGLWIGVEFTAIARQHIRLQQYRYLSPAYYTEKRKDGEFVIAVHSVAITNTPRMVGNRPWVAGLSTTTTTTTAEETMNKELLLKIAANMGLDVDKDAEAEVILASIAAHKIPPPAPQPAPQPLAPIEAALKVTGQTAVLAAISALQSKGTQIEALQAKVADLAAKQAEAAAEELLGKFSASITPAMLAEGGEENVWRTLARTDPDQFRRIAASLPRQIPAPLDTGTKQTAAYKPSELDLRMAAIMGTPVAALEKYNQGEK